MSIITSVTGAPLTHSGDEYFRVYMKSLRKPYDIIINQKIGKRLLKYGSMTLCILSIFNYVFFTTKKKFLFNKVIQVWHDSWHNYVF